MEVRRHGQREMGASRVPSETGVLAFRTVARAFFLMVVMPSPDSRVGRFDFSFFGVLLHISWLKVPK